MAEADAPAGAPGEAFFYFATADVAETMVVLQQCYVLAREAAPTLATQIHNVILGLLRDVNLAAAEIAGVSEGLIIRKMYETTSGNRPISGNMESHVRSLPGPLGLVEVALIDELNKIVNPNGWGPYWRAQEYGTGTNEVPSQEGRLIYGTFEPGGEPPDPDQRGRGVGGDAEFIPGGNAPGLGRISVELPGRHFLEDGTAEAAQRYLTRMNAVRLKWDAEIHAITAEIGKLAERGSFRGVIDA